MIGTLIARPRQNDLSGWRLNDKVNLNIDLFNRRSGGVIGDRFSVIVVVVIIVIGFTSAVGASYW